MSRLYPHHLAARWVATALGLPLLLLAGCAHQKAPAASTPAAQAGAPAMAQSVPGTAAQGITSAASQPQASASPAHTRAAQDLIARAEATYSSGVKNYQAGRLDAARLDFDSAVDMMLTSGMDLRNDPPVAEEFDRLLSAVNSLEMSALKQGNGLSPPIEAAPLENANDVTFPANPELTARLNAELKSTQSDFPLVVNNYVAGFISYFSNSPGGHAHLLRSLERAGKYKDMISRILREEGVPQDLIYLAVAESGFQPQALNARSGAGGMWQFMPTGAYGLTRNGWVDERFDPEKSSRAYARYIKSLYNQFGDWYLAMAAYDWGPGYVQRAVMHTGYADFWELYRRNALPAETKNYVPGIIAAIIMAKNPQQYGLDKVTPDPAVLADTVSIDYPIDLRLVADLTDATPQEIVALNPSLLRMTTPSDEPFDLHLPVGTLQTYTERLQQIPLDKRTSWRFHVVRAGESIGTIASALHSHPGDIIEANDLSANDPVDPGDELVVPVALASATSHTQRYTTRRGDTLVTVADRFNISPQDLRRWNHLTSAALRPGRTLNVAEPVRLAPSSRGRTRSHRGSRRSASSSSPSTTSAPSSKLSKNSKNLKNRGVSKTSASRSSAPAGRTAAKTTPASSKTASKSTSTSAKKSSTKRKH